MAKNDFNFKDIDMSTVVLIIIIVLVLYFVFSEDRPDPKHKLINYNMKVGVGPKDYHIGMDTSASMNSNSMDIDGGINVGQERLYASSGVNYGQDNKYGLEAGLGFGEPNKGDDDLELGFGYNSNKEDLYFNLEGFENEEKINVEPNQCVIVLFHATWCGYCKQFMPDWDKFKHKMDGKMVNGKQVGIREVESEDAMIKNYEIEGYPTVKAIDSNGNETTYEGARDLKGLMAFASEVV